VGSTCHRLREGEAARRASSGGYLGEKADWAGVRELAAGLAGAGGPRGLLGGLGWKRSRNRVGREEGLGIFRKGFK
jgi:hypothetical protein